MKDSYQMYRDDLRTILASFSGQQGTLVIPRAFIEFFGSLEAALLFHQCLYWSDRAQEKDRWFYKTYKDWQEELGLSEYQVRRIIKSVQGYIETKVMKAAGNPTVHYRVKWDDFSVSFLHFLRERTLKNSGNEPLKTPVSYVHRLPTEITTKTTLYKGTAAQENQEPPWPDWYAILWAIPGFKVPLAAAAAWLERKGISEEAAEGTAYALKSKWPGPTRSPYRDPWATFQNWAKRTTTEERSIGRRPTAPGRPSEEKGTFAGIGVTYGDRGDAEPAPN